MGWRRRRARPWARLPQTGGAFGGVYRAAAAEGEQAVAAVSLVVGVGSLNRLHGRLRLVRRRDRQRTPGRPPPGSRARRPNASVPVSPGSVTSSSLVPLALRSSEGAVRIDLAPTRIPSDTRKWGMLCPLPGGYVRWEKGSCTRSPLKSIITFFMRMYSCRAWTPRSRPYPLCFMPPNGAWAAALR
jgi:hypothetical protein